MESQTLFQKRHLTFGSISNVTYPLDIWAYVFEFLDVKSCKVFFEVCKAFSTFCSKEFINKHAHKGDSLFKMCKEAIWFDPNQFLSVRFHEESIRSLESIKQVPSHIFKVKGLRFSVLRELSQDSKETFESVMWSNSVHIAINFNLTDDDLEYILSFLNRINALLFLGHWLSNPLARWSSIQRFISLGYRTTFGLRVNIPISFEELMLYNGIFWTYQKITLHPSIPLEYILDHHEENWNWFVIKLRDDWTRDLVTKCVALKKTGCELLSKIPYNEINPKEPIDVAEMDWIPGLNSTNSLGLFKCIPKGYVESYIRYKPASFELINDAYASYHDLGFILAKKPFDADELKGIIGSIREKEAHLSRCLPFFWTYICLNPSLTYRFIKSLDRTLLFKLDIKSLLSNPSFGFVDIYKVITNQSTKR